MGCPDWPKCFGLWIPPTSVDQLPTDYLTRFTEQGQVVHVFNPLKTWVEYINRLLGALLGFFLLFNLVASFLRSERKYLFTFFALLLLAFTAFQAWLGALTVYSNLAVSRISIHMFVALLILFLSVLNLLFVSNKFKMNFPVHVNYPQIVPIRYWYISIVLFVFTLTQIVLGVSVRETVDTTLMSLDRSSVSPNFGFSFYIHRSISILILLLSLLLLRISKRFESTSYFGTISKYNLLFVFCLIALGSILFYFNFPAWAQPLHLLFSFLLISTQFIYVVLLFRNHFGSVRFESQATLSNG
jgi:cytochrome c oxidase assembly protein subunit 15